MQPHRDLRRSAPLGETWLAMATPVTTAALLEHELHEMDGPLSVTSLACTHVIRLEAPILAATLRCDLGLGSFSLSNFERSCAERGWSVVVRHRGGEHGIGTPAGVDAGRAALLVASSRRDGRAFKFHGQEALRGERSVAEILECTEIERVECLRAPVTNDAVIETTEYLRPLLADGVMVLHVRPLANGRFQPLESATRHRCCAAA